MGAERAQDGQEELSRHGPLPPPQPWGRARATRRRSVTRRAAPHAPASRAGPRQPGPRAGRGPSPGRRARGPPRGWGPRLSRGDFGPGQAVAGREGRSSRWPSPTTAPPWGPGARTHGSTRVSSGSPRARACSWSWNMGSVLSAAARPRPGTSTAGGEGVRLAPRPPSVLAVCWPGVRLGGGVGRDRGGPRELGPRGIWRPGGQAGSCQGPSPGEPPRLRGCGPPWPLSQTPTLLSPLRRAPTDPLPRPSPLPACQGLHPVWGTASGKPSVMPRPAASPTRPPRPLPPKP